MNTSSSYTSRISKLDAGNIFKIVAKIMYGREIDFSSITEELSKLKTGGEIRYEHLHIISDERIWPFNKWWRWPSKENIENQLTKTEGLFQCLLGLPRRHEEREEKDKEIFNVLYYDIFKHLELVSIILRFIDEENFAIYSPPVARILDHPRGYSYASEYMNYLSALRKYRDIYRLDKVAQVDMFLWAIEILGDERKGILELFHSSFTKKRRSSVINRIIQENVFGKKDLEKAIFYLDVGAVDTAAKWAGCAFEDAIHKACNKLSIPKYDDYGRRNLRTLVKKLCFRKEYNDLHLIDALEKRNKASHPSGYQFTSGEARWMINTTQDIIKI